MAKDAWNWSSAEVQNFFRNNAARYLDDRPHWSLPDSDLFLRVLESECVDGIMLLAHIGTTELKEDLGIKNMRERTAVLHCIAKLRNESQGYADSQGQRQAQNDSIGTKTPISVQVVAPLGTAGDARPGSPLAPIGENVRVGEQQVCDVKGNKRRRLNPTVVTDASMSQNPTKLIRSDASKDWFTRSACPVQQLFYGVSDFGQVIKGSDLPAEILPNPITDVEGTERIQDLENQEDNFQFYDTIGMGEIEQLLQYCPIARDCMRTPEIPEDHATVIQLDIHRKAIAIREDAVLLESDYTDVAPMEGVADDNGQWDFLLAKYHETGDNELPLWGESDDENSESSSYDRELADDDATDISDDNINITKTNASEIIDTVMNEIANVWSDRRIPALEKSRAWTVWKRMKGSQSQKQRLIASAESIIAKLDNRLRKLKDEILLDQWRTEAALREQCKALEVSIEDREEQRWMISVWHRRKEPAHVAHTLGSATHPRTSTTISTARNVALPVRDKLSVSPTPATHNEATLKSVLEIEDHQTVREGSEIVQGVEHDNLDSDKISVNRTAEHNPNDQLIEDPEEASASLEPDLATDEFAEDEIDTSSISFDKNDNLSSNDNLPSPQQFLPSRTVENLHTPKTSKPPTELIDLTVISSDDSPTKDGRISAASKKKPSLESKAEDEDAKKPTVFTGVPTDADYKEVDSWMFSRLERVQDRGRLLIKLLRNMDQAFRSRLHDHCLAKNSSKGSGLSAYLRSALKDFHSGAILDDDQDTSRTIEVLARLFLSWHDCDHSIMERETQDIKWLHVWRTIDHQILMFTRLLISYLNIGKSKLFVENKPNKSDAPIMIDSSGEDDAVKTTPHKKRKRKVHADSFAKTTRQTAQERLVRFRNLVHPLNPDRLDSMQTSEGEHQQIAINPAKDEEHDDIHINARIASKMKNHQIDGVRFMWREITARDGDAYQGCILAHTMGLGKTMQTIALLAAVFESSQSSRQKTICQLPRHLKRKHRRGDGQLRVLVLCPPALLPNWSREIDLWAPELFQVYSITSATKAKGAQLAELEHWHRSGGIMLLGYTTFRSMIQRKNGDWSRLSEDKQHIVDDILLDGTELVVADEAHTFKNRATAISECVMRFKTKSRIALTGTPMSNHVGEVYAMMNWIAPGYLGEVTEFNAHYREPIEEGQYLESSRDEIRKSIKKLAVLRHEIEPKVHRADITVLKGLLSKKVEFMITVPLTSAQAESYKRFVAALLGNGEGDEKVSQVTMFGWLEALTLLGNHPLPFRRKLLDPLKLRVNESGQEEKTSTSVVEVDDQDPKAAKPDEQLGDPGGDGLAEATDLRVLGLSDEKVQHILEPLANSIDPSLSLKTSLFVDILGHARRAGDKMLVFSLKLRTLEYLSDLLTSLGIKYGRLEGKTPMNDRVKLLENFHAPDSVLEVLLISTRAGGVGWNITGANRVVIFDFGFNPSDEAQAIGRAYRLGQTKPVYVYRFVGGGTFEMDMHNKQLFKTGLAQRVVDKKNPRRNAMRNTRDYLYEPREERQEDLKEWLGKDPYVLDQVITQDTADGKQPRIRAIKTTETLEQDAMDAPLNEQERREVDQEIAMGQDRIRKLGKRPFVDTPNLGWQAANLLPPSTAPVHPRVFPAPSQVNSSFPQTQPERPPGSTQPPIPKLKLRNPQPLRPNLGGLPNIPFDLNGRLPFPGPGVPGPATQGPHQ
nr:protein chromatin remodeling 20 [Quercus suber]